jgi:hypothetical protein
MSHEQEKLFNLYQYFCFAAHENVPVPTMANMTGRFYFFGSIILLVIRYTKILCFLIIAVGRVGFGSRSHNTDPRIRIRKNLIHSEHWKFPVFRIRIRADPLLTASRIRICYILYGSGSLQTWMLRYVLLVSLLSTKLLLPIAAKEVIPYY